MKTINRTYLPKQIKYNNKLYVCDSTKTIQSDTIKVLVLSRNLKGKLNIHGKYYEPSVFYFNPLKLSKDFTINEYQSFLINFDLNSFEGLIGQDVYYSQKVYGLHKVIDWNFEKSEYLIELDNHKFYSNPFKLIKKE